MTCVPCGELLVTDVILHLGYASDAVLMSVIVSAAFLAFSDRPFFSFSCIYVLFFYTIGIFVCWRNAASSNFRELVADLGFIALLIFCFFSSRDRQFAK